jgi:hypothetical protein
MKVDPGLGLVALGVGEDDGVRVEREVGVGVAVGGSAAAYRSADAKGLAVTGVMGSVAPPATNTSPLPRSVAACP